MVDLDGAQRFVLTHARLLERHRLAVLLHDADVDGVLGSLDGYQNADGGFGQALEPDIRSPHSEATATLTALELLAEYGALDSSSAERALTWVGSVVRSDGGIPFMRHISAPYPHAPWMQAADEGSHLTFGFAAIAHQAGSEETWLGASQSWRWQELNDTGKMSGYVLKYAFAFLDAHSQDPRTESIWKELGAHLGPDGCVPVSGGTDDEKLTPLALSPRPDSASRALWSAQRIQADLDRLADEQDDDGGWSFDWLEWCPAQGLDWRGIQTVQALRVLRHHAAL